jgi:aspartate aminotransferase
MLERAARGALPSAHVPTIMRLSRRANGISLSITLALDARAKALAATGADVVNMSVGEPDFEAPAVAREAAAARARSGPVRYTPAAGTSELRRALARYLQTTRKTSYAPEDIVVCHSTKHALSGAVLALVDPGDEVLLFQPAWVSYVEIVRVAGGVAVGVDPRPDLGPDFAAIRAAITPRTRAVLLNSPCNPSGYVWTLAEVRRLVALAAEHDLAILSDEIYQRLIYEGEPHLSPASVGPEGRERTIVLDGASKSLAMTGYRIGFAAGPRPVIDAIIAMHSQLTGAPNTVSQVAYCAALETPGGEPPEVQSMVAEFDKRRRFVLAGLSELGLATPYPRGAFYAFPDVGDWMDERGSVGFCEDLLEAKQLALVPGAAFGLDRHVRLSYATSLEVIREALARLGAFLSERG